MADIFDAIRNDDTNRLRLLILQGADVNFVLNGLSPLLVVSMRRLSNINLTLLKSC